MGTEIYLVILLGFMIIGAIIAVEMKNLLSSVIAVGAVGFGLSVSFLFLRAPDLAIVQVAVEVVLLIFLIRATISRDTVPTQGHIPWPGVVVVAILVIGVFVFGLFAFRDLNELGEPVMATVAGAPSSTYLVYHRWGTGDIRSYEHGDVYRANADGKRANNLTSDIDAGFFSSANPLGWR